MVLNRLRNKLRSCRGFTLVEMVTTLAIVVLVTLVVGMGIAFAATEFARSMELSEAKVLQSTLSNAIGNELTATQEIHSASKAVTGTVDGKDHTVYELGTYFSKSFGDDCELVAMQDGVPASYGQIYQVNSEDGDKQPLLSKSTYTRGLQASVSIGYADGPNEPENGRFSVTIGIYNEKGDLIIEDTVFDFVPYSEPAIDGEGGHSGGGHSGGGSSSGSASSGASSGGSSSSSGGAEPTDGTQADVVETSYSTVLINWSGFTWQTMTDANGVPFKAAVNYDQIGLIYYQGKYYKPIQENGQDSTDYFRSESWATPFVVSHLGDGQFYNHGYGPRKWVVAG